MVVDSLAAPMCALGLTGQSVTWSRGATLCWPCRAGMGTGTEAQQSAHLGG